MCDECLVACRDAQHSVLREHGARIDRQIDEHLLDLAGIGGDQAELGIEIDFQPNVFSDQSREHRAGAFDQIVQV